MQDGNISRQLAQDFYSFIVEWVRFVEYCLKDNLTIPKLHKPWLARQNLTSRVGRKCTKRWFYVFFKGVIRIHSNNLYDTAGPNFDPHRMVEWLRYSHPDEVGRTAPQDNGPAQAGTADQAEKTANAHGGQVTQELPLMTKKKKKPKKWKKSKKKQ
jgi:hypothetical protein